MPSNRTRKNLIYQLCFLAAVAIGAYFAAVYNGINLVNEAYSLETFKIWAIVIIIGAYIAVGALLVKFSKTSESKEILAAKLAIERERLQLQFDRLEKFEKTLDRVNQAIVIIGKDDKIEWFNAGFEKMTGYKSEEIIGSSASDLLAGPSTDREVIKKIDEAVFKNHQPLTTDVLHYRKDKSSFWAKLGLTPMITEEGELERYIAISEDVTEAIESRNELHKSEANFRQISDTMRDTFYLYCISNKSYEYISQNCVDNLGVEAQDFYDHKHADQIHVHPDDKDLYNAATEQVNAGIPYTIEYRILVDGTWRWIEESSYPIENEDGQTIRNSGVCSDITEKKLIESELKLKNKEILGSINYAQRIQNATLTKESEIRQIFPDYTLLYKPKDIVSGDFYNVSRIRTNSGQTLNSIVVADCTGHGVPGAVLAITCSQIVQSTFTNKRINSPAEALDFTRQSLMKLFDQAENQIYDGMDLSWCVWNETSNEIYFSGANNNLYIVRDEAVMTIHGDRMHVGFNEEPKPFTNQTVPVRSGDLVFLTTDGFVDQFGGPSRKKIGRNRFFTLIESYEQDKLDQQEIIEEAFEVWKGDVPQTDDVCVFGFRIP